MLTSVEKVDQLRAGARSAPGGDAEPMELMLRTLARNAGPLLDSILPRDPASLDEMLEQTCRWLASLRSDDAPEVVIYEDDDLVDADVVDDTRR